MNTQYSKLKPPNLHNLQTSLIIPNLFTSRSDWPLCEKTQIIPCNTLLRSKLRSAKVNMIITVHKY